MKKNNLQSYLFSVVGVIVMFVILAGIYIIVSATGMRADMTEEKLYTLSDGTRAILKKLDTPVQIRFYCTQGKEMPVEFKTYAERVEDLLNEYQKVAGKNLEIKKFNPEPDSDAEDSANLAGVEGQQISLSGDKIYMGIAVSMLDSNVALPFLDPRRERLLEYDLTRAIANVTTTEKQVIGVMSGLPIFGAMDPMMMRMGQPRQDPWLFINELKRDFTVKEIQMAADQIDADVKILVVLHPKQITDKAQYAIDQFVMRGGKLIAFLDPLSIVESQSMPQQQRFQQAAQGGSNLEKLTKAWGVSFDSSKVIADMVFKTQMGGRGQQPQTLPAVLSLTPQGINTNDVVTSQLDNVLMLFAGTFSGTPASGLTQTVLLHTTKDSQPIDRFMAEFSGEQATKDFKASGTEQPLAIRLVGKFKTAFPEGAPAAPPAEGEKKDEAKPAEGLKESAAETAVILVGDSDLLYDHYAAQIQNFMGQKMAFPMNGNLSLMQNMVEQLSGDSNLIAVRSRATQRRPFTKVREMQNAAEERFRGTIRDLEKQVQDAQTKLSELQRNKEAGQRFIISPEQQAEIEKVRKVQAEANKKLKQERKNLRRDIDSLENTLKWTNILGMPVLVAMTGVSLAFLKRKKTAAK